MASPLPEVLTKYKEKCGVTSENARKSSRQKSTGSICVRGTWYPYSATTQFDAGRFQYRWNAKIRIACGGLVSVRATDMHRDSYAYGGSKLFNLIPAGSRKGDDDIAAIQVTRHLAEMVFVPDMILENDKDIVWASTAGGFTATSKISEDRSVTVKFSLDENGDVKEAYSEARPYDIPGGYAASPWKVEFSNHKDMGQFRIPTVAVYTYLKEGGDEEYQRIQITSAN